jgi:hypothetical protein
VGRCPGTNEATQPAGRAASAVLTRHLPEGQLERLTLLMEAAPPGVQPVGWTPAELRAELARGNPMAKEAFEAGIVLSGSLRALD